MSSRMTLPDARWFSDHRPTCAIENEIQNKLGAKNIYEYSDELKKQGKQVYSLVQKVPVVQVQSTDFQIPSVKFDPNPQQF